MPIVLSFRHRYQRNGGLLLAWLLLSGCQPQNAIEQDWRDYQQRLARVQQLSPPAAAPLNLPQLPALRDLRVAEVSTELSLLDSLRLDSCAVAALIHQRNSSLGRLQQGLLNYYDDILIADGLLDCAAQLPSAALAARLRLAASEKQQSLGQLKQQALVQEQALRSSLSMGRRSLDQPDPSTLAPVLAAWSVVLQTLASQHPSELPARAQLVAALEVLTKDQYSGALWRGMLEQQQALQQSTALLSDVVARSGCSAVAVPKRAEVLRTIAINYFAARLQVRLAAYQTEARQLAAVLDALVQQSSVAGLNDYLRQLSQLPAQLQQATVSHAQAWQRLFQACGFVAGREPAN